MHDLISRRINAERLVVFGWSRAILLQLAHPLVAAAVVEHSSFRGGGVSAILRLHHTIRVMLALVFGHESARRAALDGIRTIHRRVNGRLPAAVGTFPAGTPYTAEDPDLVLWVHATLLESIPMVYELLVEPLTGDGRDAYCAEGVAVAVELGARRHEVPRTWAENAAYLESMSRSGIITVGAQARELAALVLSPPFGRLAAPAAWTNRLITVGLLPEEIRRQFGCVWSEASAQRMRRVAAFVRSARRVTPPAVALWPEARVQGRPRGPGLHA
jgi:uncharacterized protein (DUF2236 family)